MSEIEAELSSLKRRTDSGIFHSPPVSSMAPAVSAVAPATRPNTAPRSAPPKSLVLKAVLLGAVCLAVLALAIVVARWPTLQKQTATAAPAPAPSTPVSDPATIPNPDQSPATSADTPATPPETPAATTTDSLPANDVPPAASTELPATKPKKLKAPPVVKTVTPPAPTPVAATPVAPTPVAPPPAARVAVVAQVNRSAAPVELVPVKLSDGLPFRIAILEDVPIDAEVGRPLRFSVLDGVKSGDTTVIAKGSIVTGSLMALAGKRNFFGERSKVRFRLITAQSVGDAKINVRATPGLQKDGVETRPFATPNGTKDKNLIAASGTEYIAYISGDQTISVHK